jgi:hypothetical protein
VSGAAGVTLDAGGLIAVDRGDRRMLVLLTRAAELGATTTVPATALAQVVRDPSRQSRLSRLVRQPSTRVVPLDRADAGHVGRLLASAGTADVVDAHVVVCARRADQAIVTGDAGDLRRLDPAARLVEI